MGSIARQLFHRLWDLQERLLLRLWRVRSVGPGTGGFLGLRVVRHSGEDVTLADGTLVRAGDAIGELHIRNSLLGDLHAEAQSPHHAAFVGRRLLDEAMRDLAASASESGPLGDVAAFRGVTLIGETGRRFGFETRQLRPGFMRWWLTLYQRILTARYHRSGTQGARKRRRRHEPLETWISRRRLLELHGADSEHLGDRDKAQAPVAERDDDAG